MGIGITVRSTRRAFNSQMHTPKLLGDRGVQGFDTRWLRRRVRRECVR